MSPACRSPVDCLVFTAFDLTVSRNEQDMMGCAPVFVDRLMTLVAKPVSLVDV